MLRLDTGTLDQLNRIGIAALRQAVDPALCRRAVEALDAIATGPWVVNHFRHNPLFFRLMENNFVDTVLTEAIDADYVLMATNAINRSIASGVDNHAGRWHVDARQSQGRVLSHLTYEVVIMLEDFTAENGSTWFKPYSHLVGHKPEPNGNYEGEQLIGKAGDIAIYDTALWHKGGTPGDKSRWGIFSMYGPWFMKPAFRYPEMLKGRVLSPYLQKIFHFTSTPPLDESEGFATLSRVRATEKR